MTKFRPEYLAISDRGDKEAHRRKPVGQSKKTVGNRKARRWSNRLNKLRAEGR